VGARIGSVILIDAPTWPGHGRLWSHLVSDDSYDELHAFAESLGVPRRAFERDHYDVPSTLYDAAVAAGALPVSSKEVVRRLVGSGLRRPKHPRGGIENGAGDSTGDGAAGSD
jgi:Protein of unknown function (DUF4031)